MELNIGNSTFAVENNCYEPMELECNEMDVDSNAGEMMDLEPQDGRTNIPTIVLSKDGDCMDIEYQEGHTSTLNMMDVGGMNGPTMMVMPDNY